MRSWMFAVVALTLGGCANAQLRYSTVKQASTLTELQYQQVLNNLAMFASDRDALPWHVNLRDGSTQVSDGGAITGQVIHDRFLTLGATRTIVDQWGSVPVTDDTELKLLRIAYRRAHGSPENLDPELVQDLAHELKKQIAVTDDLRETTKKFLDSQSERAKRIVEGQVLLEKQRIMSTPALKEKFLQDLGLDQERMKAWTAERNNPELDTLITNMLRQRFDEHQVFDDQTVTLDDECFICDLSQEPCVAHIGPVGTYPCSSPDHGSCKRSPLSKEVCRQIKDVNHELGEIGPGWFGVGHCRKDVPKDACYVGHHKTPCGESYVWVCAQNRAQLADFTLKVLKLSSLLKESQVLTIPGGVKFSPALSNPGGGAFFVR